MTGREPLTLSPLWNWCSSRSRTVPLSHGVSVSRWTLGGSSRRSPENCGQGVRGGTAAAPPSPPPRAAPSPPHLAPGGLAVAVGGSPAGSQHQGRGRHQLLRQQPVPVGRRLHRVQQHEVAAPHHQPLPVGPRLGQRLPHPPVVVVEEPPMDLEEEGGRLRPGGCPHPGPGTPPRRAPSP